MGRSSRVGGFGRPCLIFRLIGLPAGHVAFGARPMKRTVQRMVLDPLAVKVLEGEFVDGDTVEVDAKDDQMVFSTIAGAVEVSTAG